MKKIVFFGTPEFAASCFQHLLEQKILIVGVVTQPDRPKGRSLQMCVSPVKAICPKQIPLFQPLRSSDPKFLEDLRALGADLFVVVAFGQILPQKLLDIPSLGCINVHASLLPKYRGAAPIQRAILNGDAKTGVCVQKMVRELDAGDVIEEAKMDLPDSMNFGELERELCNLSKELLIDVLKKYEHSIPKAKPQDPQLVTFAPKIMPEELKINWTHSNISIHNQIRAFSPKPGAWAQIILNGELRRLKILSSTPVNKKLKVAEVLLDKKLIIGCGVGALEIHIVQPEGKAKMKSEDWLRGFRSLPQDLFL